ncbi:hypothetical protein ACFWM3_00300 [Gottfriedia sp. NPDC058432]|uniref:hypothetical protein n=1 Tax=Gottfriedia sp. NPDC058432 TaxID=3346497 RepID=UPI0036476697
MNIQLKQRFKQFAKNECENSSGLYEYLSLSDRRFLPQLREGLITPVIGGR